MKENLTGKTELLEPAKITELILSENFRPKGSCG